METIVWNNISQFSSQFLGQLKNELDPGYVIEADKRIGSKYIDLFIKNKNSGKSYLVEIKGRDKQSSLPPEIIPWLDELKEKTEKELNTPSDQNHVIVISLSRVNESVEKLFNENGIEVFDYGKHSNPTADFVNLLEKIEGRPAL